MDSIKEQIKEYIRQVHYNKVLKSKVQEVQRIKKQRLNDIDNTIKEIENLKKVKIEKIGIIKNLKKEDDKKVIWLRNKPIKKYKVPQIIKTMFSFDGYLFYGNKANDFTLHKIKDLSMIYNLVDKKETYNLVDKIGTMNNKPLFIVKYPYAISLNIDEKTQSLYYDPKAYYQYVNHATKLNLLSKEQKGTIGEFIKKNLIVIIIIIVGIIFLSTPQGQKIISDLALQMKG